MACVLLASIFIESSFCEDKCDPNFSLPYAYTRSSIYLGKLEQKGTGKPIKGSEKTDNRPASAKQGKPTGNSGIPYKS